MLPLLCDSGIGYHPMAEGGRISGVDNKLGARLRAEKGQRRGSIACLGSSPERICRRRKPGEPMLCRLVPPCPRETLRTKALYIVGNRTLIPAQSQLPISPPEVVRTVVHQVAVTAILDVVTYNEVVQETGAMKMPLFPNRSPCCTGTS